MNDEIGWAGVLVFTGCLIALAVTVVSVLIGIT